MDGDLAAIGRSLGDNMLRFWEAAEELVIDESTRPQEGACPVRQYALFFSIFP